MALQAKLRQSRLGGDADARVPQRQSALNKAAKTQCGHSYARCMISCIAVSVVTAVPVSTNVTACHVCCGTAKLWGTMTQAATASTLCIVPLYSMMISVVSVFLSSLTDNLAQALNPACSSVHIRSSCEAAAAVCWLLVYKMVPASEMSNYAMWVLHNEGGDNAYL